MTKDLIDRMRILEIDHEPDGWPAVQMRDISAMLDEVERRHGIGGELIAARRERDELREQLQTRRAGTRAVIEAAVNLVCSPAWSGMSDEDVALEQALRDAGFVMIDALLGAIA
jgi:hypothetical protein